MNVPQCSENSHTCSCHLHSNKWQSLTAQNSSVKKHLLLVELNLTWDLTWRWLVPSCVIPFWKERGRSVGYQNWIKCLKCGHTTDPHSNAFCFILQSFPSNYSHSSWGSGFLILLCCWIDNIMDSPIKPLRKEILELIASSETITKCVFPPCASLHIDQQWISSAILSKCLTIWAWGSIPASPPCPAGFAQLRPWTGCLELSHQHRGNKSAGKLHQHRMAHSSFKKWPKSRGTAGTHFKAVGSRKKLVGLSHQPGAWGFGKHIAQSQHCSCKHQNTVQIHTETEYKWRSPPKGTASFLCYPTTPCGVIWCTEQAAFLLWCFLSPPHPPFQGSAVTLMVNLFLKEVLAFSSQGALCFCWRQGQQVRDSCFWSVDPDKAPQREELSQGSE